MFVQSRCCPSALLCMLLLGGPAWGQEDSSEVQSKKPSATFTAEQKFLDRDGDGKIDAAELAAGQQAAAMLLMLSVEECDRDGDGQISKSEFRQAASEALKAMQEQDANVDPNAEQEAESAPVQALSLGLVLDRLAADERYAAEVAALRRAVENLDDDQAVTTYLFANPTQYPHLTPLVRTWICYYPVRPELRRHVPPHPRWRPHAVPHANPHGPNPKPEKPAPPKVVKPDAKPGPGPGHAPAGPKHSSGHRR